MSSAMTDFFNSQGKGGLLGLYDLFVGGGLSHATVFALGIMPYISASIFMQIAGVVIPTVEKMQKDEEGRKRVTQWTTPPSRPHIPVLPTLISLRGHTAPSQRRKP